MTLCMPEFITNPSNNLKHKTMNFEETNIVINCFYMKKPGLVRNT